MGYLKLTTNGNDDKFVSGGFSSKSELISANLNEPILITSNVNPQMAILEGYKVTKITIIYGNGSPNLDLTVTHYPDGTGATNAPNTWVGQLTTYSDRDFIFYIEPLQQPVTTTETITETESIPFETVNQDNPDLEIGQSNVIQEGINGERSITYEVTYSDGVETSRVEISSTVTAEPVNKIVENGTAEPIVYGYINISGSNAVLTMTNSDNENITIALNESVQLPTGDYNLEIRANTSFYITGFFGTDKYGRDVNIPFEGDGKIVNLPITITTGSEWYSFTNDRYEEDTETPVPEPDFTGFNHLYLMDKTAMSSLANDRFTAPSGNPGESIDLGVNIINILELPFPLKPEFLRAEKNVVLGVSTLSTVGIELTADRYIIDFGEIEIPHKYNNSYDFQNTEIKLHLPFTDIITLPVEYVIGQTIKIKYSIDLYSGDTDIIISSSKVNGNVFHSQQIKIGRNIPFVRKSGESVISSSSQNGLNNEVYSPFVEVVRNKPYNAGGKFDTPVPVQAVLNEMNGFVRVEDIQLQTHATQDEQQSIRNLLREGVFINGENQ